MVRIIFCVIYLLLAVSMPEGAAAQNVNAQNVDAHKEKIQKIEQDIAFLDKQIEETGARQKNSLQELTLIRQKINSRKKLLTEIDNRLKEQNDRISEKNVSLKKLEDRLDTLEQYYGHLISNAYKNRDTRVWFMYILASNSIEQGYRRWSYLKNYSRSIREQSEKIREARRELIAEREALTELKKSTLEVQQQREKEYDGLKREEKQAQDYIKSLNTRQAQFKKQLEQKKQEADRLNREMQKMIAEALKSQTAKQGDPPKPADPKLSGVFRDNKGKLPWPVSQGVIVEQFGEHNHPLFKGVKLPFNNGVNISAPRNSPVKAVFDGTIKQVIVIPGYNQCILVQHGTYFTFYCKLGRVSVKAGETVKTGDTLGTLDDSTLHFELWNGTAKQNPELWLRGQ